MIAQELQRDDVEQSLQTVNSLRNADRLDMLQEFRVVVIVANDHRSCLSCGDLRKCGFNFSKEGISGHHDDDWHVLVDQRERAVFKFPGKDTFTDIRIYKRR